MSTAALVGFGASVVSGWLMLADRLTTASTAAVSSRAYGPAAWARCCALMIRDDAMSSWALVILAVDLTVLIRRLTARSCAPIGYFFSTFGTRLVTASWSISVSS